VDSAVFFGGSVVAAVVAGAIALFAPCCVSVMLPAYLAGAFKNRATLVAMTLVFAAGVATVILPIALGAQAFRRLFTAQHTAVFTTGALLMLGLGVYTLLGGQIHLPMPGRRAGGRGGISGVYLLGVFSGVASSCCAPVLAGVIALSGVASSFAIALGLGVAYVFGMVAPLFAISLLWERRDWGTSPLFRPRSFTWRIGPIRRTIPGTSLASGLLLVLMGVATLWIATTRSAMPSPGGWSGALSARLQHYGHLIARAAAWIPGWAALFAIALTLVLLIRRGLREVRGPDVQDPTSEALRRKESSVEQQDR
jgi:cytochrome c-type biogenesis protein